MTNLKTLAEQLVNLTVKQANELSDILKNEYGIESSTTSPIATSVTSSVPEVVSESILEKTKFDIIIKSVGTSKLAIVKLVKEITGLSLKEAKDLIDSLPSTIKENLSKEEADNIKIKLEEAGAEVHMK